MHITKNIVISGTGNLPMTLDIFFEEDGKKKPVVIYVHGFNGFKDWGNFDLVAKKFVIAGFVLVKFNFSHNGTTPAHPEEFADLEAFGNNNYTKQLQDLSLVIDWVWDASNSYHEALDTNNIYLIGHSMGGGISILQAAADTRIKKLITWAAISECKTPWGNWPPKKMQHWKKSGVEHYTNTRTNQQMPLYYQLYEDYLQNQSKLDIQKAIKKLDIPLLICHGTNDISVPLESALELKSWQPSAALFTLETNHVFGRKHPWILNDLPAEMQTVVDKCLQFLA